MRALLIFICICMAGTVMARDPAATARQALADLASASAQLAEARSARDRITALTQSIGALESGLTVLRENLRDLRIEEMRLQQSLAEREAEITALLATLMTIAPEARTQMFVHPQTASDALRAGMLLADITPELARQATLLRDQILWADTVSQTRREATAQISDTLNELQTARLDLNTAMAARSDIPRRFAADPERMERLRLSAENLDTLTAGLTRFTTARDQDSRAQSAPTAGKWREPAAGRILRTPGEADAAGIARPGLLISTEPGALVTAPVGATVLYGGPFLDFGQVLILEPEAGMMIVLGGLAEIYTNMGEIIEIGAPLGLMQGLEPDLTDKAASTGGEGAGTTRRDALYIEVRSDNVPLDPRDWFPAYEDG